MWHISQIVKARRQVLYMSAFHLFYHEYHPLAIFLVSDWFRISFQFSGTRVSFFTGFFRFCIPCECVYHSKNKQDEIWRDTFGRWITETKLSCSTKKRLTPIFLKLGWTKTRFQSGAEYEPRETPPPTLESFSLQHSYTASGSIYLTWFWS